MHEVMIDTFLDSHNQLPQEITLDYDATDDPIYCNQEKNFLMDSMTDTAYLPLYVFCGNQLLVSCLRPSSV